MIKSKGAKNLSATTIKKIRRMIAAVLAEPELYRQNSYVQGSTRDVCGTTCCGAGWAVWCENQSKFKKMALVDLRGGCPEWNEEALKALDLDIDDSDDDDMLSKLFGYASEWPEPFADRYNNANTPKARAKVFAARWEKFISSDGTV